MYEEAPFVIGTHRSPQGVLLSSTGERDEMKRCPRRIWGLALTSVALLLCVLALVPSAHFQVQAHPEVTKPPLGTAGTFAVLGGSAVTNTGPTVVNGDLGVSPGTAVTGFPPGIVNGTRHVADAVALQGQKDVTGAYVNAAGQPCNVNLTGQDLGGKTLTSGVSCFSSSAHLTGQLTLDGQGNPASVFLFQVGSTLTTASNASVLLINGAQACNIFWQVGSSATVGTTTRFAGNILALTSISFTTGAVSNGGLYARNGAVTLDTNTITRSPCANGITPTPTGTPPGTPSGTPPPGTPTSTPPTGTPGTPTSTPPGIPTGTPTGPPGMPPTGSDPGGSVAFCHSTPIESGNHVWLDITGNGLQDIGEPSRAGVPVPVSATTLLKTALTDAPGDSSLPISSSPGDVIKLDKSADSTSGPLKGFHVTGANQEIRTYSADPKGVLPRAGTPIGTGNDFQVTGGSHAPGQHDHPCDVRLSLRAHSSLPQSRLQES